jgi:FkbM family methyltransferase
MVEQFTLPNGLEIKHVNLHETLHLYRDIFERRVYLDNEISLAPSAIVLDTGANIGLFSLFVLQECPSAIVHAFEPAPKTFTALAENLAPYRRAIANNFGAGEVEVQELLTYLPNSTCGSGYYEPSSILIMKKRLKAAILADPERSRKYRNELGEELLDLRLDDAFKSEKILTRVAPLGDYIDRMQIPEIDLLKIDVEGRECSVLAGIKEPQWLRIKQVVIEVHARVGNPLQQIQTFLEEHEYKITSIPEEGWLTTMVYARR